MHNDTFHSKKDVKSTKIALISDIHYYDDYKQKILTKLLKQTQNGNPNYICILGDILDSSKITNTKPLYKWLEDLGKIAPVFIVFGNHDEKDGSLGKWKWNTNQEYINTITKIKNIHCLNNNTITKDNISFYGFNLSYKYYEIDDELYQTFSDEVKDLNPRFNNETYNIILFHSPINIYKYIEQNKNHPFNKCDLILSGHMHNGCLPKFITYPLNKIFKTNRSIISPLRTIFPDNSQGKVYNKCKDGYIFEGISKLSHSTRLFHYLDIFYPKHVHFITIKKD